MKNLIGEYAKDVRKRTLSAKDSAVNAVTGLQDALSQKFQALVDKSEVLARKPAKVRAKFTAAVNLAQKRFEERVLETRNQVADQVITTGAVANLATTIGTGIALASAGGLPLLIFADIPAELGQQVSDAFAKASIQLRGNATQFIGLDVRTEEKKKGIFKSTTEKTTVAIIYDPLHPQSEASGFVRLDQEGLTSVIIDMLDEEDSPRYTTYMQALLARESYDLGLTNLDYKPPADDECVL